MAETPRLGGKIRTLRRNAGLTQTKLAEMLGISPSYLNLIEHNRRALPAMLLLKLAQQFDLELAAFQDDDTARLESELMEVFGDVLFVPHDITNVDVRELVHHHPNAARAVRSLYAALQGTREQAQALAQGPDTVAGRSVLPSEEVSEFIQTHMNHFPELETAAARLIADAGLEPNDIQSGLVRYLEDVLNIRVRFVRAGSLGRTVRRLNRKRKELEISEVLPPRTRNFQLAHAVALLSHSDLLDDLADDPTLTLPESGRLGRIALANYFAGAVLMPYEAFLTACEEERYDVELIGHRFRVSFEQVCHRMTTLRRPGREGVAFHLIRIDIAGNISKRFSASGIRFARYSGACPRWNVFQALLTPGRVQTQMSVMPEGETFFCFARTLSKGDAGYHVTPSVHAIGLGCSVSQANKLVYADGWDLSTLANAVPLGVSCRL
jgi:predicted transcriptional regulator/DNA-binding XRE family transcriptional regulator